MAREKENNFVEKTKRLLQHSVGSICSNSECQTLTTGPNCDENKYTNHGVAAHITAASAGGPRYDPSMTSEQRSHYDNGIWLCTHCSFTIDKNYQEFSIELLQQWKKDAEDFARDVLNRKKTYIPPQLLKNWERKLIEKDFKIEDISKELENLKQKYLSLKESIGSDDNDSKEIQCAIDNGENETVKELLFKRLEKQQDERESKEKDEAKTYFQLGEIAELDINYNEAKDYYDNAVKYDNLNCSYVSALSNILYVIGNYEDALKYYEKALKIFSGSEIEIASIYNNMAVIFGIYDDYGKAVEYYDYALHIYLKEYGEEHLFVATIYNNIGTIFMATHDYINAIKNYEKSLYITIKLVGNDHIDVSINYSNLGEVYNLSGEYSKSLTYNLKALKIALLSVGEKHQDTAIIYNNIGEVYKSKRKFSKAIVNYEKSLNIKKELLGEEHLSTSSTYNNLGAVYHLINKNDLALIYLEKSLSIKLKILGEKHSSTISAYNNIGVIYKSLKNKDLAFEYFDKALNVALENYGDKDINVSTAYNNLGEIFFENKEYKKAKSYLEKSLSIIENLFDKNNPELITIKKNLELVENLESGI